MNIGLILTEIADRLKTVEGLRVSAIPQRSITPPAAFPLLPNGIRYDQTYGRGVTNVEGLEVWAAVGKATERAAVASLGEYVSDVGAKSIKVVLEGRQGVNWDDLQVVSAEIGELTIGGVDYLGAVFTLNLACKGS
jgi:hypothetical protein